MGEIDHADDAVDHRVTDGDQSIDCAERNAVYELLEKILHTGSTPIPVCVPLTP